MISAVLLSASILNFIKFQKSKFQISNNWKVIDNDSRPFCIQSHCRWASGMSITSRAIVGDPAGCQLPSAFLWFLVRKIVEQKSGNCKPLWESYTLLLVNLFQKWNIPFCWPCVVLLIAKTCSRLRNNHLTTWIHCFIKQDKRLWCMLS